MANNQFTFPTAPLNSPAFTGVPTAPTAIPGTNTTQLATTAFVAAASGGSGWNLTGNAGTNAATNFVGTTDDINFSIRQNNVRGALISNDVQKNAFFGGRAGLNATSSFNTLIGANAGEALTSGGTNNAFGVQALRNATTAANNTAFGANTLFSTTTGNENLAVGNSSLQNNTTGAQNLCIGNGSGIQNTTGNLNLYIGFRANFGASFGSASNSIGIGNNVLVSASGDKNLVIGDNAAVVSQFSSYQMNIGNLLWGSGCIGSGTTPGGRLGIGTNAPNASAILDLSSTNQGFGLPNLTNAAILAISTPKTGLMLYNTTINHPCFYNGTAWQRISHSPM